MIYSRSTQYAIRAMARLAALPAGTFVPVRDLAHDAQVPLAFLAKIMQTLTRRGLLASQKGPGGGIALSRAAAAITLEDIVVAVDGQELVSTCILGLQRCSDASPCVVHEEWKRLRNELQRSLHERTLADIVPAGPATRRRKSARTARRRT